MIGHGEKFSRKQEQAIIALLTSSTIADAAKLAGIGEVTLWRWLQTPDFQEQYRKARRLSLEATIARLQRATGEAVETLQLVAKSDDAPASARVSAAKSILEMAMKATEIEDIEIRIKALEKVINAKEAAG